jgi:hypothetical protein
MRLAYSPVLPLIESHVGIYKIYVLKNPLKDNCVFYVGQTTKELEERLNGHIAETGANRAKINYIKQIIEGGSKPIIESVEVIRATCYADKLMLNEREIYWIKYYKALGVELLNAASTKEDAKCHEYHHYMSSLKRGEAHARYYYCGKTRNGDEVYDEERLRRDGFRFTPEPQEKTEYSHSEPINNYNPWQNERYLKSIGYDNYYEAMYCIGTKTTYEKVYKDLDPEYYEQDNCTLFL